MWGAGCGVWRFVAACIGCTVLLNFDDGFGGFDVNPELLHFHGGMTLHVSV
jgi:hypothetical protein